MEQERKITEEALKFEALDRLAFDFSRVHDIKMLASLNFEEHAYVMSMAYLYTMHRLGSLSTEYCKKVKRLRIKECHSIHNSYEFARHLQERWVLCTKKYAAEKRELVRMVKEKDPRALIKALEVIDLLTDEYVYTKLAGNLENWNDEIVFLEDVADETISESGYDDNRQALKAVMYRIIDALESGEIVSPEEYMTPEEIDGIVGNIPQKEALTEELMSKLMPRVK